MPRPRKDQFDYINRQHGLKLKAGKPLVYTTLMGVRRHGQIVRTDPPGGHRIMIRFNGSTQIDGPFHPTWRIEHS